VVDAAVRQWFYSGLDRVDSQKIRDQASLAIPDGSHMNFGGLVLSGNLDQTITQLNASHDLRPQRHEPS
jgi:hypothetical protein